MVEERVQRKLAAILAADVVGYSRLMDADEVTTLARLKTLRAEVFDPKTAEYGGRIFKVTGDGALAEFPSAADAVQSAVDVQRALAERNARLPQDERLDLRIGISLGDVIVEGDDLYGNGVNVAARLEAMAEPGGICVSGNVHEHIRNAVEIGFEDLGEQLVKNIDRPVRAYRVLTDPDMAGELLTAPVKRTVRWQWPAAAAAFAAVAIVAAVAWWQPWAPELEPASVEKMALSLPDKPSIAVLPFANMSSDKEQDIFADGIAEDVITDLSKISGLFVIARNSSFAFRDKAVPIKKIARELGVRYVLEGSVRRSQDRLRVTAQLIDARTEDHLWAERYDRKLSEVFSVQDEIREKIVNALEVEIKAEEQKKFIRRYVSSPAVYDMFLRARRAVTSGPTPQRVDTAKKIAERIMEVAPDFAGGYAIKSWAHSISVRMGYSSHPREDVQTALELAKRAYELDDNFGWSVQALSGAYLMMREHDKAVAVGERAVLVQPGDADTLIFHGYALMWAGRAEAALRHIEDGLRLNPKGFGFRDQNFAGFANYLLGRYGKAMEHFEKNQGRCMPPASIALQFCVAAYAMADQSEKAKATAQRLLERYPNYKIRVFSSKLPFKRDEDRQHLIRGLRKAGLPE